MERASVFFKRIMLGILLAVMGLTLGLVIWQGVSARSYLVALLGGAALAGGLTWLLPRYSLPMPRRPGLWVGVFCFALNIIWVLLVHIRPFSDYDEYWQVACALAAGRPIPDAWYVAMYPHILGTATFLSGLIRLFGESVFAVTVVNVLLTSLSCTLLFFAAKEMLSEEQAFLAALLWAFTPCKMMLGSLVFSEPLYTFLILLFFWLFLRLAPLVGAEGPVPWAAVGGVSLLGLLLALINIVWPIAVILIIALVLWIVLLRGAEAKRPGTWGMWLLALFLLLGLYKGALTLWDGHVERVLAEKPASVPWYNIYVGFNEETAGRYTDADMDLLTAYLKEGMSADEAQRHMIPHVAERLRAGINFPKLLSAKLFAFLGNDELGGYTYRFTRPELFVKVCMVICNIFYYAVFLSGFAGLLRMFSSRSLGPGLLLPLYFLGLTLAHMLVEVANRYHYSLIPILIIFAALGLTAEERSQP